MSTIGEDLQQFSYEYLLSLALAQVPETVDKREGSIIYDAIAPACYILAEFFLQMYTFSLETSVLTATGENLEARTSEFGVHRKEATSAVKKAILKDESGNPASASVGNRFVSISETNPLYYIVTAQYSEDGNVVPGEYEVTCETPGVEGHQYTGNIIPLDYLPQVATATLEDVLVPGSNVEADEELRSRYLDTVNSRTFGGNIANYREMLSGIAGIGAVQIYPVWNGGGTVKASIVDSTYRRASEEFVGRVQDEVDPLAAQGQGIGKAPIDHKVTIVTPDEISINVSGNVVLSAGYSLSQIQIPVEEAIEQYLLSLRASWGKGTELNEYHLSIYVAQVIRAILAVPGIANVTSVTLNGKSTDIELLENGSVQQIPILGEVKLNG